MYFATRYAYASNAAAAALLPSALAAFTSLKSEDTPDNP